MILLDYLVVIGRLCDNEIQDVFQMSTDDKLKEIEQTGLAWIIKNANHHIENGDNEKLSGCVIFCRLDSRWVPRHLIHEFVDNVLPHMPK